MIISRPGRRGFASLTALLLLGMVAVALTALGALVAQDARRTRDGRVEAQLRQMLAAGAAAALDRASAGQVREASSVALPSKLTSRGGSVIVHFENPRPDSISAKVEASVDERRMRQSIILTKTPAGWEIAEARLQ